jgi:hypothetical protein
MNLVVCFEVIPGSRKALGHKPNSVATRLIEYIGDLMVDRFYPMLNPFDELDRFSKRRVNSGGNGSSDHLSLAETILFVNLPNLTFRHALAWDFCVGILRFILVASK